jgi:endonuclease V
VVNATGRNHPRRAGLAFHLGAVLGLPTVGVTTRPLVAEGVWPVDQRAATASLRLGARWWAAGGGPGRGPSRWRSIPPGRPTPRRRSRWCWPRPAVPGAQSPCAAPAHSPEPGGRAAAERSDACRPTVRLPGRRRLQLPEPGRGVQSRRLGRGEQAASRRRPGLIRARTLPVAGTCPQPIPSPSAGSGRSPIHVELTNATFESPEISIRRVGGPTVSPEAAVTWTTPEDLRPVSQAQ